MVYGGFYRFNFLIYFYIIIWRYHIFKKLNVRCITLVMVCPFWYHLDDVLMAWGVSPSWCCFCFYGYHKDDANKPYWYITLVMCGGIERVSPWWCCQLNKTYHLHDTLAYRWYHQDDILTQPKGVSLRWWLPHQIYKNDYRGD